MGSEHNGKKADDHTAIMNGLFLAFFGSSSMEKISTGTHAYLIPLLLKKKGCSKMDFFAACFATGIEQGSFCLFTNEPILKPVF